MIYLEKEASDLYFELSQFHFHTEKLSWTHYLDRMLSLKNMCEPSDPIYKRASRILLVEEWDSEEVWSDGEYGDPTSESSRNDANVSDEIQSGLSRDRKGYFHFLSGKKRFK